MIEGNFSWGRKLLRTNFNFEPQIIWGALLAIAALTVFTFFSVINSYNMFLTGDQMNTFANMGGIHQIQFNGRWGADLWIKVTNRLPFASLSWLVVILCHWLSALMLSSLWKIKSRYLFFTFSLILTTNFTLTYTISWWYLFTVYQMGVLFAIAAVYLPTIIKNWFVGVIVGSICIMLSLASYQPHLSVFATLLLLNVLLQIIKELKLPPRKYWLHEFSPQVCAFFMGIFFYFISLKVIASSLGKIKRIEGSVIDSPDVFFQKALMTAKFFISRVSPYYDNIFFIDWKLYDGVFWFYIVALLSIAWIGVVIRFIKNRYKLGLLLIIPGSISILFFSYIHVYLINNMITSQWAARSSGGLLMVILFSITVSHLFSNKKIKTASTIFVILFFSISTYKALTLSDQVKMRGITRLSRYQILASQIISTPGFKPGMTITPVSLKDKGINWDHCISYAYAMRNIFWFPIKVSTRGNSINFENRIDEWGQGMAVWPAGNSIKIFENNVLVVMKDP